MTEYRLSDPPQFDLRRGRRGWLLVVVLALLGWGALLGVLALLAQIAGVTS